MGSANIITEVVEIPLTVSFPTFLQQFQQELLQVLLKDDGVVSVRTGLKTQPSDSDGKSQVWAVSITEWKSLEAHKLFTEKEESGPFFGALGIFSKGPPTIDHFGFSSLKSLAQSECARLSFCSDKVQLETLAGAGVVAGSLDNSGTYCRVGPVHPSDKLVAPTFGRTFDVVWYSFERKPVPHL